MSLVRWLAVLGCLCLLAIPAQAQPTVSTFGGAATDTKYTEYGTGTGLTMSGGPTGAANYYRLTMAGVGSTNNIIAFDLSATGPTSHVVGDFDFRIGGMPGTHADGIGVVLIPTSVYQKTGNGPPSISEEGSNAFDGAIGFGLDTYNNGLPFDVGNANLPNGTDASEVSVNYQGATARSIFIDAVDLYSMSIGGMTSAYNLHNDNFDDATSPFDHCHFTVDIGSSGAAVTVQITSNQFPASSSNPLANPTTTIPAGTTFTAVSSTIPGVAPYEMRLGFGGRTGGANDTHDIANVNVTFSP
jgi:hypothetical protein